MHRLKIETQPMHHALESHARMKALMSDDLTHAEYTHLLRRLYGFYAPLETRLAAWDAETVAINPQQRRKTAWLAQDLQALSPDALTSALPRCNSLPAVDGVAAALGCWYVLEGATLGGQIICRHLRQQLGLGAETGLRFYTGYGHHTGMQWRTFQAAADDIMVGHSDAEAIRSARSTFKSLETWLNCE